MSFSTIRTSGVAIVVLVAASTVFGVAPAHAAAGCVTGMFDLDGDGHKDVAVGAPNASVDGKAGAGLVQIRMRTDAGEVVRTLTAPLPHPGDHFGAAVGDVDLSKHADELSPCSSLVVGAPGWDAGSDLDAGAVFVFPTLDATPPLRLDQNFNDESPGTQSNAHFGAVITEQSTGNQGGALGRDPVFYASAPDYDLGVTTDAGVVQRITLTQSSTPSVAGVQTITGDGFRASAEKGDRFGAAMTGTPYPDELVVGVPGESIGNARRAGEVMFWTPESARVVNQDSAGVPGVAESGDGFGSAVFLGSEVANEAQRGGHVVPTRLFVGTPREDIAGKADAGGVVQLTYDPPASVGQRGRILTSGAGFWTQDTAGVAGSAEQGDRFGSATESLDLSTTGAATFVVGTPGEDLGSVRDAGAVYTLGGGRVYDESSAGVPGTVEAGDLFGATLGSLRDIATGLPLSSVPPGPGTWSGGLLVGVPGEDGSGVVVSGLPHGTSTTSRQWSGPGPGARYGAVLSATR